MAMYQMSDKQIRAELMSSPIVSIPLTPRRLGSAFNAYRCAVVALYITIILGIVQYGVIARGYL